MNTTRIYNMAMAELLRQINREEQLLAERQTNAIAFHRLKRLENEAAELHRLIVDAERDNAR